MGIKAPRSSFGTSTMKLKFSLRPSGARWIPFAILPAPISKPLWSPMKPPLFSPASTAASATSKSSSPIAVLLTLRQFLEFRNTYSKKCNGKDEKRPDRIERPFRPTVPGCRLQIIVVIEQSAFYENPFVTNGEHANPHVHV